MNDILRWLVAGTLVLTFSPPSAHAQSGALYYIGAFAGMASPQDTTTCGPAPTPCATLAYWTASRRSILTEGDTVRLAPGTYSSAGGSTNNCIVPSAHVTYEGRTEADGDLDDFTSVAIDLDGCGSQGTCKCSGLWHDNGDVSGFTIRDMKISGGSAHGTSSQNAGIRFHTAGKDVLSRDVTVDRVWVTDVDRQGIIFNMPQSPMVDCGPTNVHESALGSSRGILRTYEDITLVDSKVSFVRGVFGGIIIGCVDGGLVENNDVHDIYGGTYSECPSSSNCNNHDGIQITGWINGTLRGNTVARAGQDSIGIGGHFKSSYDLLVEDNVFLPSAKRLGKVSGQAGPNIVFRNNYFGSDGHTFKTTACAYGVKFHNNTFRNTGDNEVLQLFDACDGCELVNNIIVGNTGSSKSLVGVSTATTDAGFVWENNVVDVIGPGKALAEFQYVSAGCTAPGCCAPQGCGCNDGTSLCDLPAYCDGTRFEPQDSSGLSAGLYDVDLSTFVLEAGDGQWFGPESGATDVWDQTPAFVDGSSSEAGDFHLDEADTVARDRGKNLDTWFTTDIDGETRGILWDIGMDEIADSGCATDAECDDGNVCTDDSCDFAGQCQNTPNTAPCDDGNPCTDDTCDGAGQCQPSFNTAPCDDGNPCTDDTCDGAGQCQSTPNAVPCDDGDACTPVDACALGACVGAGTLDCDDGNVCTDDSCDFAVGCAYLANADVCDDGDACTPDGSCSLGTCVGSGTLDCDDGNLCTDDGCDAVSGCVSTANAAPCDDDDACTTSDSCSSGACIGTGAPGCDDGNSCTDDGCDSSVGCVHLANNQPCDDGDACTPIDTCSAGTCTGLGALDCDDGNVCSDDSCDLSGGCVHIANSAPCDDGDACTPNDTCSAGTCTGTGALDCDDGNACTDDGCDSSSGCASTPNTSPCDDGDACTTMDGCVVGVCVGSVELQCDDGVFCNGVETCDTIDQCQPGIAPCADQICDEAGAQCVECLTATDCTDSVFCNGVEDCVAGACQAGLTPCPGQICDESGTACVDCVTDADCSDGVFCNGPESCNAAGACEPGVAACSGQLCDEAGDACVECLVAGDCDDGAFCNGAESCAAGSCAAGTAPCTDQLCREGDDACVDCLVAGDCDDGLFCTGAEACSVDGVCATGLDPCPAATCNESGDTCESVPIARLEGVTASAGESHTTVSLTNAYADPVVVCSVHYQNNSVPVVPRVSNVTSTSFDVRLQNPSGEPVVTDTVSCLVAEKGVWTIDGVAFEAQSYTSSVTDSKRSWAGESQSYGQSYQSPVVVGQVMTENDPRWSTFWCRGSKRTTPPSATELYTGKTVAEDADTVRVDETVGFIVFDSTHGSLAGVEFESAVGADSVRGISNDPPYVYSFAPPFSAAPVVVVANTAGMDGADGGWAQGHGSAPATPASALLSIDEDQLGDSERSHTSEQVAYLAFASEFAATTQPACTADTDCDDGLYCTGTERCEGGECSAGATPCPGSVCRESDDSCVGCLGDGDCDDGSYCNGVETCGASATCEPGTPPDCDDGIDCTLDQCDDALASCEQMPDDTWCDNGDFCDGPETCAPATGCSAGTDPCGGAACDESADVCEGATNETLWMSFKTTTAVPGVGTVQDEDVVEYDITTDSWSLIFDGSDVGLGETEIDGLAIRDSGALLLSFTSEETVPGLAGGPGGGETVDDSDIVAFTPTSLGTDTSGSFSFYFDGSDVGLTSGGEDVDAISLTTDGRLIVSTTGSIKADGASGSDEDLHVFTDSTLGESTSGTFSLLFDGSDVALSESSGEDVDAANVGAAGDILLSTRDSFTVPGISGADEDVLSFSPAVLGSSTAGSYASFLDLSTIGISSGEDIGSLHVPR